MNRITCFLGIVMIVCSCERKQSAAEIIQEAISTIDTIQTIYYKQDMARTDPQNNNNTIVRYREMYFKRLLSDSIVGVKGHWYMYAEDKERVLYEDIYDGNRLLRKNLQDSLVRIYDLEIHPAFKRKHFWSHNTPYGMQYEFKYILKHQDLYSLERVNDTVVDNKSCYQVIVLLKNKRSMPGFAYKPEDDEGSISKTSYFIDKETYFPLKMTGIFYSADDPEQKTFIDQRYFDIKFNIEINESEKFNTTLATAVGFKTKEMLPE